MTQLSIGCRLCPRQCGADRAGGTPGYCGVAEPGIYAARAALHLWEEPCISGETGSGAVFFSGCPLRCVYCQNYSIARAQVGKPISVCLLYTSWRSLISILRQPSGRWEQRSARSTSRCCGRSASQSEMQSAKQTKKMCIRDRSNCLL